MNWLELIRDIAPSLAQGGTLTRQGITGIGVTMITTGATTGQIPLIAAGAAVWLGSIAWGLLRRTQASTAADAGQIPGVKVMVGANAPPSVVAVAKDPAAPNVKLAA